MNKDGSIGLALTITDIPTEGFHLPSVQYIPRTANKSPATTSQEHGPVCDNDESPSKGVFFKEWVQDKRQK